MKLYKLTDADGVTGREYKKTTWIPGFVSPLLSGGGSICGPGFYHAYAHPLVAVFCNPIHAGFGEKTMRLWAVEGEIAADDGLKVGCCRLTCVREVQLPDFPLPARTRAAILIALDAPEWDGKAAWSGWAAKWLDGSDRSASAAASVVWSVAWSASRAAGAAWSSAASAAAKAWGAAERAARFVLLPYLERAIAEEAALAATEDGDV